MLTRSGNKRALRTSLNKGLEAAGKFMGRRNPGTLLALSGAVAGVVSLFQAGQAKAANYFFDQNGTTAGFGMTNGGTYVWDTTSTVWDVATTGTTTGILWPGGSSGAGFVGSGTAGDSYTIKLGSSDNQSVVLQNLGLNWNLSNATAMGTGDVTIGTVGGSGTLTVNASNSIGTINGTLTINSAYALGGTTTNFRGGNIVFNGNITGSAATAIATASSGGLSSGTLTLAGNNSYTGTTTASTNYTILATKAAALSGYGTASKVVFNGGVIGVRMGDGTTGWSSTQVDTLLTNATKTSGFLGIDTSNGNVTQWTSFGTTTASLGTLGLAKLGNNTLILNSANTYTGGTRIDAGTVQMSGSGTLGASSSALVMYGGTLDLNGTNQSVAAAGTAAGSTILNNNSGTTSTLTIGVTSGNTLGGTITDHASGTGVVAVKKSGTGTINISGSNSYSGGTTIDSNGSTSGVSVAISNSNALGTGAVALASSYNSTGLGALALSGGITVANPININDSAGRNNIFSTAGANSLTGNISITGNGNIVLIGNNASDNAQMTIGALGSSTISSSSMTSNLSFRGTSTGGGVINSRISLTNAGGGTVDLNGATNWQINSTGNTWTVTGILNTGNLTLGATNALPVSRFDGTGAGALILNGYNQSLAGLNGPTTTGTIKNNASTNDSTLTLSGLTGDWGYNGVISDGSSKKLALVMNSSGRVQTLTGTNSYTGGTTITAGTLQIGSGGTAGSLSTSSTIIDNGTLAFNRSDAISQGTQFSGSAITGTGKLVQSGSGTTTLTAANTYSGGTAVSNGVLALNHTGDSNPAIKGNVAISGSAGTVATRGKLYLQQDNQLESTAAISFTGTYGDFILGGHSQTIGGLSSDGGSYQYIENSFDAMGSGAGTLTLNNSADVSLGANLMIRDYGGTASSGTLAMVKDGSGALSLGSIYNFANTGGWTLKAGALRLGANFDKDLSLQGGVLSSASGTARTITSDITWAGNVTLGDATNYGTLTIQTGSSTLTGNRTLTVASAVTISQNIGESSSGYGITKAGSGMLTLSGTNSFTGDVTINAGSVQILGAGALGGVTAITMSGTSNSALVLGDGVVAGSGKSLTIKGGGVGSYFGSLSTPTTNTGTSEWQGSVTVGAAQARIGSQGGTLKISGVIGGGDANWVGSGGSSGLIIRNNGGMTVFSGANNYLGDTQVLVGTLQLAGGSNRLPVSTKVWLGGVGSSTGVLDLNGQDQEVAGLAVSGGGGTSNEVKSATAATLTINTAAASTYAGLISGSVALTKMGSDKLTLSSTNTYTGETTINGGTLAVNGSLGNTAVAVNNTGILGGTGTIAGAVTVNSGGHLAPGNSPGALVINNTLTLNSGSVSDFEIASTSSYDQVTGLTGITYGGTLNVTGSIASTSHTYTLFSLSSGTPSGDFSSVNLAAAPTGYRWHDFDAGAGVDYFNNASGTIQLELASGAAVKLSAVANALSGSLRSDTTDTNDENGNNAVGTIHVTGSNGGFVSEIDGLTNEAGVHDFADGYVQVDNDLSPAPTLVMLWLKDNDGVGGVAKSDVIDYLAANAGGAYTVLTSSDEQWQKLAGAYSGFDTIIDFGSVMGTGDAFSWKFEGDYAVITVDKVAVVPEPGSLGLLGLGALGLMGSRRRKQKKTGGETALGRFYGRRRIA